MNFQVSEDSDIQRSTSNIQGKDGAPFEIDMKSMLDDKRKERKKVMVVWKILQRLSDRHHFGRVALMMNP